MTGLGNVMVSRTTGLSKSHSVSPVVVSFIPAKATTSDDPLGLKVAEIDRDNPAMANAPDGVMVTRVNPGSPASGKILRGDIISMIQSKSKKYEIYDTDDFEFVVEASKCGCE